MKDLNSQLGARVEIQKACGEALKESLLSGSYRADLAENQAQALLGSQGCGANEMCNPTKYLMLREEHWVRRSGTPRLQ